MSKDLLIEIGTEEMPARFISKVIKQMADHLRNWLDENKIRYSNLIQYSTPRRLTVIVLGIEENQEDRLEEIKGPSINIAKDESGDWSKAAEGFARGQEVPLESLYVKRAKNIDYVYAKKEYKGKDVRYLLNHVIKTIIESINCPRSMRWGDYDIPFIRPIRWLVVLLGIELIPIEIAGVKSSNVTQGHRFLGHSVSIPSANKYKELLKEQYVIVNPDERRKIIKQQIEEIERANQWQIPMDEELLAEVVQLVEYPTVLFGTFREEFLDLPKEVLATTMKNYQKFFPVNDSSGNLLPYFITVRNGDNRSLSLVRKGNERAINARLTDVRFFFIEDQKIEITEAISKLENIVFQKELGTIGDKVRRIKDISLKVANHLHLDECTISDITLTSEICKFDLVTNMVYQFPELKGIMGKHYAIIHGEKEEVSEGIYEHYLPRDMNDLPEHIIGQIVSVADKLDNIVGAFSLDNFPTSSHDPLGLRKQANGIIHILLRMHTDIELGFLYREVIHSYDKQGLLKKSSEEVLVDLHDFFTLRLKKLLQNQNIPSDVIDAVTESNRNNVKILVDKAKSIRKEIENPSFKNTVESFTRVMNIAVKAKEVEIDVDSFVEDIEGNLYELYMKVKEETEELLDTDLILDQLKKLKEPIDLYFDNVMIMVEDDYLRQQRLGLMLAIAKLIKDFADFSKLVFK